MQISEKVKPHPLIISLLTKVEDVIPKWKIVPTKDVIDLAFKDPVKREEVSSSNGCMVYCISALSWISFIYGLQIRNNKLIYQHKPKLKTALEMLRTSMNLEESLHQVLN